MTFEYRQIKRHAISIGFKHKPSFGRCNDKLIILPQYDAAVHYATVTEEEEEEEEEEDLFAK